MGTLDQLRGTIRSGADRGLDLDDVKRAHAAALADPASEAVRTRWVLALGLYLPYVLPLGGIAGNLPNLFRNMEQAYAARPGFYEDLLGWLADQVERDDAGAFLVVWEGKPWLLVECKTSDTGGLRIEQRFADKLGVSHRFRVTLDSSKDYLDKPTGVRVIPAERFLAGLV